MHTDDPPRLASRGASFAPETRRVGNEFFRKIGNPQNLIAMKIRQLDFRSWRKEKLVFFQAVHVGLELWELRCADHANAPHQKRRTKIDDLFADFVNTRFEVICCLSARFFSANLPAQTIAFGL